MPNQAMPGFQVTSVTPFTSFTPGQGPTPGFNVNFTTTTGITAGVFIPTAQIADTNYVGTQISQLVAQLHAVHSLTGGPAQ